MRALGVLLWAVLIVSPLAAVLSWLLDVMGAGLRSTGAGSGSAVDMAWWAMAFAVSFVLALLLKVGLVVRAAYARDAVSSPPRPARASAPGYTWTCFVCQSSNPARQEACAVCDSPANLTSAEIKLARSRLAPPDSSSSAALPR